MVDQGRTASASPLEGHALLVRVVEVEKPRAFLFGKDTRGTYQGQERHYSCRCGATKTNAGGDAPTWFIGHCLELLGAELGPIPTGG